MTYLSQFPGAKYTPRMGRFRDIDMMPTVGIDTKFTLQTSDAAMVPEINIRGPTESLIPYTLCRLSETVYNFIYRPEIAGEYEVIPLLLNFKFIIFCYKSNIFS